MTTGREAKVPPNGTQLTTNGIAHNSIAKKITKKRIRNFTADDRAAHRVFEKSRREAFKERLIELASLLPSLTNTDPRRLSKHVVVDESIRRIKFQQARCDAAVSEINALRREREELLTEVNQWRSRYSCGEVDLKQPRAIDETIAGLLEMEQEAVPGNFPDALGEYATQSDEPGESSRDDYEEASAAGQPLLQEQPAAVQAAGSASLTHPQLSPAQLSRNIEEMQFPEEAFIAGGATKTVPNTIPTLQPGLATLPNIPISTRESHSILETSDQAPLMNLRQLTEIEQNSMLCELNQNEMVDYPVLDSLGMGSRQSPSIDELQQGMPFTTTELEAYPSIMDAPIQIELARQYPQQMIWYFRGG